MGTVFLARMAGSAGFSRLVAIKRLHPTLAAERDFVAMLVDEARLAAQIRHVNVIDTLDLVATDGAFSLVLEYVEGASLSGLVARANQLGEEIPRNIAVAILRGMLRGLDAAHDSATPDGRPLGLVHRDVSPQNVLVGADGIPRIIDFGIAKAMGKTMETQPGVVRGKFAYMAPEQLLGHAVTRQADVYAAGVVLWELLTAERAFKFEDERAVIAAVLHGGALVVSEVKPDLPPAFDPIVVKATARDVADRYASARELLDALAPFDGATDEQVGAWVRRIGADHLARTRALLQNASDAPRTLDEVLQELEESKPPATTREPTRADAATVAPNDATMTVVTPPAPGMEEDAPNRPEPTPRRSRSLAVLAIAAGLALIGGTLGVLGTRPRSSNETTTGATSPAEAVAVTKSAPGDAGPLVHTENDALPSASVSAVTLPERPARASGLPLKGPPPKPTRAVPSSPRRDQDLDHR